MASGRTTSSAVLAQCPACRKDLIADMALDVELHLGDEVGDDRTVPATVTLKGVRVQHDCIPSVTRTSPAGGGSISEALSTLRQGRPTPPAGPAAMGSLIERSSLGTPEAKAARESVSPEDAARVVERSEQLRVGPRRIKDNPQA